ncbi:YitT family protein [Clostridium zeae]|uniref:YitT family protein n=1 Tax=Clostridium zeae TaxID=2759022 RepID=UPI001A8F73CE|nr:YitT family protein [Clostridium zeae]
MMRTFKKYLYITIGVFLITISLEYFFFPNDIAAGGVSGLAIVINAITGISVGTLMIIFNIFLFIIAFIFIGGGFGAKSIYATFALSGLLWLFDTFIGPKAFTENYILVVVFGSAIQAVGIAIIFNQNASTGGTSIIAKILNKYFHIDIGKALLISDFIVTLLAIYAFGADKGMFGLISVYLTGTLVDSVIEGFTIAKAVFIISSISENVAQFIMNDLGRGCTYLDIRGAYTKEKTSMLFTVVNRKQFIVLKNKVRELDPNAFITVTDSKEVLGEGFKDLDEE